MFPRRILFATDFSRLSAKAERASGVLARELGAELEVFHAIAPFPSAARRDSALRRLSRQLSKEAFFRLESSAARLRAMGVSPRARLVTAVAWQAVLARAEEIRADLIVIGTHRSWKSRSIPFGTTSHRIVLASRCPVLVVPAAR